MTAHSLSWWQHPPILMWAIKVDIFVGSFKHILLEIHQKWSYNSPIWWPIEPLDQNHAYSSRALTLAWFKHHNLLDSWNLGLIHSLLKNRPLEPSNHIKFSSIGSYLPSKNWARRECICFAQESKIRQKRWLEGKIVGLLFWATNYLTTYPKLN